MPVDKIVVTEDPRVVGGEFVKDPGLLTTRGCRVNVPRPFDQVPQRIRGCQGSLSVAARKQDNEFSLRSGRGAGNAALEGFKLQADQLAERRKRHETSLPHKVRRVSGVKSC